MRKLSHIVALGGLLAICAGQANAQFISVSPLNVTAAPGGSFTETYQIMNGGLAVYTFQANPLTLGPVTAIPPQAFGTFNPNTSYTPQAPGPTDAFVWWVDPSTQDFSPIAKNGSRTYQVDFLLGNSNNIPAGGYRANMTANDTASQQYNAAINLTVATPEFGSVLSLGGLLLAGSAGLWVRRRRGGPVRVRMDKAKTEAS